MEYATARDIIQEIVAKVQLYRMHYNKHATVLYLSRDVFIRLRQETLETQFAADGIWSCRNLVIYLVEMPANNLKDYIEVA